MQFVLYWPVFLVWIHRETVAVIFSLSFALYISRFLLDSCFPSFSSPGHGGSYKNVVYRAYGIRIDFSVFFC